jgi:signal transduction histidine kinase
MPRSNRKEWRLSDNLLTSILGTAELLIRRSDIPESARNQLSLIIRAAERGDSLTHRLLAFSRRQALGRTSSREIAKLFR